MQNINWTQVLVFALVAAVVFVLGIAVLFLLMGGGWAMMGSRGMHGGWWCPWCGGTGRLGGSLIGPLLGLTLTCLLPLVVLVLLVGGAVWLMRNTGGGSQD